MARAYAGTVMLEGATLSEGRGTTRPLEIFGAPDIDARAVIAEMRSLAPQWLGGCQLREISFEPTFHKHVGKLCHGVHIHAEGPAYDHAAFKPWRVQALAFKAIRRLYPDYDLWRDFPYEYEFGKLAIDVINGGPGASRVGGRPGGNPRRSRLDHPARRRGLGRPNASPTCSTDGGRGFRVLKLTTDAEREDRAINRFRVSTKSIGATFGGRHRRFGPTGFEH
jgi:hypothetical protein